MDTQVSQPEPEALHSELQPEPEQARALTELEVSMVVGVLVVVNVTGTISFCALDIDLILSEGWGLCN